MRSWSSSAPCIWRPFCQRVSSGHSGVEPESFILLDTLDGPFSWMSKMVLFFSSAASNASQWTAKEIGIANARSKPIIPVRLDGSSFSKEVEFDLVNNDFVDFTDDATREVAMAKLLKSVAIKCRG